MTRETMTCPPDAMLRLIDEVGITQAAEKIGISPSAVSKAKADNVVRQAFELAAAYVLGERGATADRIVICTVPESKAEAFCAVVRAMNIKTTNLVR